MIYVIYVETRKGHGEMWHVEMTPPEAALLAEDLEQDVERGVLGDAFVSPPETIKIPLGDFIRVMKVVAPSALKKRWAP